MKKSIFTIIYAMRTAGFLKNQNFVLNLWVFTMKTLNKDRFYHLTGIK